MASADIFAVGAADFRTRVIEASRRRPVLVDFWAAWCGPCRMLGPVLERVVERSGGAVALAKVDSDREPDLAARYQVRGLPTVKLFRDGEVVDEFVGARPEGAVEAFLAPHLPDPAAAAVQEAGRLTAAGRREEAVTVLESAHAEHPASAALAGALGERYLERGLAARARALYDGLPAPAQADPAGRALAARLRFAETLARAPAPGALSTRAEEGDAEALFLLAAYDVMAGRFEDAAGRLFRILQGDAGWGGGRARQALLDLMEIAGGGDARVGAWRRRLAQLLY